MEVDSACVGVKSEPQDVIHFYPGSDILVLNFEPTYMIEYVDSSLIPFLDRYFIPLIL